MRPCMPKDLSVLITARNEEFLARTVEDVLHKRRANTDVIVVLDGAWAEPPLPDHPDVTILYHNQSRGQRTGVNEAAKLSDARFIMKLDAHCILDEGFDTKLIADYKEGWIVVPAQLNLHAFNWKCKKCGNEWYQGPTPTHCMLPGEARQVNNTCDSMEFERVIVWKPRHHRRSEFMRFDSDLHFQYWGDFKNRPEAQHDLAPTMSCVGASWFLSRELYWKLGGMDEEHGSWGQMGTEIACKAWLSGGALMVNKKTWFAHLFRTQGGDFGFPYPIDNKQVAHAREHSKDTWRHNKWQGQKHSLRWLVEKFWPIPGWTQEELDKLPKDNKPTKGIIYYTDNQLKLKIAHKCKRQIKKAGLPIVSASLKPMTDMGKNVHIKLERGYLAYFTQIYEALKASDADIIFFCEHDWLYHPSHFDFTPDRNDVYYYNDNWWRLRLSDGLAVSYDTHLLPTICAYRSLLLEHYGKALEMIRQGVKPYDIGFEPGTHNREQRPTNYKCASWKSDKPNIDLRHENNLTKSKWHPSEFRSQRNCRNWQETHDIPGWGQVTI